VVIASCFGLVGHALCRRRCEPAPLLLGFILGPLIEETMRRALLISHGDPAVFIQRPTSATFLVLALALVIVLAAPAIRTARERAFKEAD
jgi:putative tricarboxylic transport membrane protein